MHIMAKTNNPKPTPRQTPKPQPKPSAPGHGEKGRLTPKPPIKPKK